MIPARVFQDQSYMMDHEKTIEAVRRALSELQKNDSDSSDGGDSSEFTVVENDTKEPHLPPLEDSEKQATSSSKRFSCEEGKLTPSNHTKSPCFNINDHELNSLHHKLNIAEKICQQLLGTNEKLINEMKEMKENSKTSQLENENLKQKITELEDLIKINDKLPPACISFTPNSNARPRFADLLKHLQEYIATKIEAEVQKSRLKKSSGDDTTTPANAEEWKKVVEELKNTLDKNTEWIESMNNCMELVQGSLVLKHLPDDSLDAEGKLKVDATFKEFLTKGQLTCQEKRECLSKLQTLVDRLDQYEALEKDWKKFDDGILDSEIQRLTLQLKETENQVENLEEDLAAERKEKEDISLLVKKYRKAVCLYCVNSYSTSDRTTCFYCNHHLSRT